MYNLSPHLGSDGLSTSQEPTQEDTTDLNIYIILLGAAYVKGKVQDFECFLGVVNK